MNRTVVAVIFAAILPAGAASAEVCVSNGAGMPYYFAAETDQGQRVGTMLADGERLCAGDGSDASGTIWVFETSDSLEGCSRQLEHGRHDRLLSFGAFDRCHWASHDQ